jgi:hypothetical protein
MRFSNRIIWSVALVGLAGATAAGACSSTKGSSDAGADVGGIGGFGGGAAGSGGATGGTGGHAGTESAGSGGQSDAGACRMEGESCNPPERCCGPLICAGVCTMGVGQNGSTDGAVGDVGSDGGHACGGSTCLADQVCVRPSCGGGTPPMCDPGLVDGGQCPLGWTYQSRCPMGYGTVPGCAPPPCSPPAPFCADVPASCGGKPSCDCLPPDVCKGGGSCGSVYTSGDVMCGFA